MQVNAYQRSDNSAEIVAVMISDDAGADARESGSEDEPNIRIAKFLEKVPYFIEWSGKVCVHKTDDVSIFEACV
jgi:hypothetical protein